MNLIKQILITVLFFSVVACNKTGTTTATMNTDVVAKINNSELSKNDVLSLMPKNISKNDSIAYLNKLINNWASNQVFYQQALNYLNDDEINIDKEIENYKKELIAYKFETKLIFEKLDTVITQQQIEEYYNANADNFMLKNNIVKVLYIKTPSVIPNFEKLKKLCYATSQKDLLQLKEMCIQYANNYYMNDNTWLLFDDLKNEMYQLKDVPEYTIQAGKTFEFTDERNFYFLKIIDVKSKNTASPLNFEKNNIRNMLINQRKQTLITAIKKDFFDKAIANKELNLIN